MSSDGHLSDDETTNVSEASDGSSQNEDGRAFIDDEAEQSVDGFSDVSDIINGGDNSFCAHVFPQFMRLPPELRHRIWEFYCPDLTAKARVLQFTLSPSSAIMVRPDHCSVKDHLTLADQTERLRVMLSIHRESRTIAVQKYPEELGMDAGSGDAIARFRKETDVIVLHGLQAGQKYFLPNFSNEIQNIAVNPWGLFFGGLLNGPVDEAIPAMKDIFNNLKRLYVHTPAQSQKTGQLRWCVTDYVHAYLVETYEKEPDLGEDTQSLFCWPDVDRHADFAKYSIPRLFSRGKDVDTGVEMWPMVEFELQEGIARYNILRAFKDIPDLGHSGGSEGASDSGDEDEDDDDDSAEGTDPDEYESDGIDDDEIVEAMSSSEDELIPKEVARFSSPESEDQQRSEEQNAPPFQRLRKRKIVVTNSDDDEVDGPQTKRARRSCMVVYSDEVEVASNQRVAKSRRPKLLYDDDEDVDEKYFREGDEDEDDSSKRLSLAERLRRARVAIPESSASDDEEEGEDEEEDDDDEEGDEEDEGDEDEGNSDNGLLDRMAGDDTADDGEDDDEDADDGW